MSSIEETPLSIIGYDLWNHTDRFPRVNNEDVLSAIGAALRTSEQPGTHPSGWLINKVIKGLDSEARSLDSEARGGLGLVGLHGIEAISELPLNPASSKAEKWGAMALLGMLAMTYNPDLHKGFLAEENPCAARAQLASIVAGGCLMRIIERSEAHSDEQKLASALSLHSRIPPEDVAIELLPLIPQEDEPDLQDGTKLEPESEEVAMGAAVGNPFQHLLDVSDPLIAKKIKGMDWIKDSFDFETQKVMGYPISKDGEEVAIVYDLTSVNTTLRKIAKDLATSPAKPQFWSLLANSVAATLENKSRQISSSKITPMYSAGRNGKNEDLLRGYYTPLGRTAEGLQRYGLVAIIRTKGHQKDALNIITKGKSFVE